MGCHQWTSKACAKKERLTGSDVIQKSNQSVPFCITCMKSTRYPFCSGMLSSQRRWGNTGCESGLRSGPMKTDSRVVAKIAKTNPPRAWRVVGPEARRRTSNGTEAGIQKRRNKPTRVTDFDRRSLGIAHYEKYQTKPKNPR
jgi:hypothetical protein